ncbi:serine/threonine-protein kinase [Iningainema tapete]|uniref:Protein kinase n=1 Tax=Iningainema tapete BLCC-T55 TaxID=2748662 RepID=A0A8J7CE35_9CYAN|nr:serine/threonine-protein kinase [Iningainema tapete]MBD2773220.1 protein kinase [Iningainema tapete BLCC-T55]
MTGIINEVIGSKYDIITKLGEGGSGIVYLAKRLNTNERYAIKTISTDDANSLKLLERETQTLKRLNHSSIVRFIENGYEQRHNLVYLVLEYLDGQNIKGYFDKGVDLKTKIDLFMQILDAVSHAHSKEVIHRDIKPDNIMVVESSEQPSAKVLDFGIAIITTTLLTNTIRSYHTPLFAAPEQIQLKGVSRDSDIYSLGMTFLYLLSNNEVRNEFREECNKEILYNSALADLKVVSELSNSLIEVLKRATDELRENRPKIDEIRKALGDLKEDLSEKLNVVFSLTPTLKNEISVLNKYDGQSLRIKRDVESKLRSNSDVIHIIKSPIQKEPSKLTVEIGVETQSYTYWGFIKLEKPNEIVLYKENSFVNTQHLERLFENGVVVKIDPVVEVGGYPRRGDDLSDLINQILQKEQQVNNEIEANKGVDATFSRWQSVIETEKEIINKRKQSFAYTKAEYNREKQLLIITLKNPISLEEFENITSPPLPVTISVKKQTPPYRESQWSVGDIIDGERSKNGELLESLYISIGDFCNPDIFESLLESGKIETDFKVQESEIDRRRKALREIRYGDSENAALCKVISEPANLQPVEPLIINDREFFNKKLDSSQKNTVCKALATEDIFLIQGPPGTGKTSVITEIVLQILSRYRDDKILISSQSNIAVDNVLTKLSNIKINEKDIKILRIGKEEKIEDRARQFEIEKAIINWQEFIRTKSLTHWQEYENQHNEILLGVKKISEIESVKSMSQQLRHMAELITRAVNRLNSDLVISSVSTSSQQAADNACEIIYEKLLLEEKILNTVKDYVKKFGIEYPEQKLLSQWIDEEYRRLQTVLGDNNQNYEKFLKLRNLKDEWNNRLKRKQIDLVPIFLDGVNVVGATCLGIANLKNLKFDWVIVDEAGRSTAPETFVPMTRGKKIILVGDHKQLPPIIDRELQERVLREQDIEKRVLETSLFEYLYEKLPKANKITLNYQYRMHPDIGTLVSNLFYQEEKVSSERVDVNDKQHLLNQFEKNIYWISTSDVPIEKSKEKAIGTSRSNRYEADIIKAILDKIQQNCESSNLLKEVGVIAAYASQISTLEAAIASKDKNIWKNLNIEIHTVDAFQGGECDIIIYDLVRSNKEKVLGFTSDDRRLNVALSRAKQLLIIVGNDVMAYEGKIPNKRPNPFKPLIEYIDTNPKSCARVVSSEFMM